MNRSLYLVVLFLLTLTFSCKTKDILMKSPSEKLGIKIEKKKQGLQLDLQQANKSMLQVDLGKFVFGGDTLGNTYQIEEVQFSSRDESWSPVSGEKSTIKDAYNEVQLVLKESGSPARSIRLICRLYEEGLAFRYLFPKTSGFGTSLNKELTGFNFDRDYEAWVTEKSQGMYQKTPISRIKTASERPLVIRQNDSSYMAIGEAALVDFARMKLIANGQKNSLQVELEGEIDLEKAKYKTPWRFVMLANSPGKLLENNYFILNLNEANKIEDPSWIKPGKVIREVSLTTQGGIACVDFAAKHNLQYIEFDAGWYGNEYDDTSDATTVTVDPKRSPGPLDLPYIIDYANDKGIGIILYVNRRALEKQLDEVLPLLKSWGIKGVKYGFVQTGPQKWTSWLHEAIRKAADYQLMVDVHDDYRPTGYSRTYPNLMTQEGIRGDEESPSTEHTLITTFTRMIAGAGDNTNCYLASRVTEKMGGKTGQMAKAILLYSPWQFLYWYDRPNASPHKKGGAGSAKGLIQSDEKLDFYDQLPVVWDETKVLEGKIGEFATIARKNKGRWFLGSLVANQSRKVAIPLTFLDKNKQYKATIYFQDKDNLKQNRIQTETRTVTQEDVLSKELLANSGLAIIISPVE